MKRSVRAGLWAGVYLLLFLLAQYAAYALLVYDRMQSRAVGWQEAAAALPHTRQTMLYALAVLIGLPVFSLLLRLRHIRWTDMLLSRPVRAGRLLLFFALGALINLSVYLISLLAQLIPWVSAYVRAADGTSLFAGGLTAPFLAAVLLSLGFLAPVYEEIVFRGLVLRELAAAIPLRRAYLLQAAAFTLYHRQLISGLFIFLLALLLGRVYARERSILAPCALHCGFNIGGYLLQALLVSLL